MVNGCMMFGTPMMLGMVFAALLLLTTLALVAGAAVKYLRSGRFAGDHRSPFGHHNGGR